MELNPGSPEAKARGCKCAVLDNNHGKYPPWPDDSAEGGGHWWITEGCPLHDVGQFKDDAQHDYQPEYAPLEPTESWVIEPESTDQQITPCEGSGQPPAGAFTMGSDPLMPNTGVCVVCGASLSLEVGHIPIHPAPVVEPTTEEVLIARETVARLEEQICFCSAHRNHDDCDESCPCGRRNVP